MYKLRTRVKGAQPATSKVSGSTGCGIGPTGPGVVVVHCGRVRIVSDGHKVRLFALSPES